MTTEYLLNRELEHVLAALTPTNELVARVCLHTGLRVSDVLALRSNQLRRRFTVVESKTGKRRTVTLPDVLLRRLQAESGEKYVFEGRYGPDTHRTRQAVYADIKRAARAFRLPQNVGTHSLRKVYAVELLRKYGDIDKVRRALNHGSLAVTSIYAMSDRLLEAKRAARRRK